MNTLERKYKWKLARIFNRFKRKKKMENTFNFNTYLIDNNFKQKTLKFFACGYITIKIVGDRFIAMNFDKRIKHKHIVTSKIPRSKEQADTIFQSCGILHSNKASEVL